VGPVRLPPFTVYDLMLTHFSSDSSIGPMPAKCLEANSHECFKSPEKSATEVRPAQGEDLIRVTFKLNDLRGREGLPIANSIVVTGDRIDRRVCVVHEI